MNSKRNMYRPASQQSLGQKRNRKTLAQGRLVTNNSLSGAGSTKGRTKTDDTGLSSSQQVQTEAIDPRISLLRATPQKNVTDRYQEADQEKLSATPRRNTPHITEHKSPKLSHPVTTLDLSDDERTLQDSYRLSQNAFPKKGSVLIVDANRQARDPNQSEVDIVVGYSDSPAKVICHSPRNIETKLRESGDVSSARHIEVDQVPSILSDSTNLQSNTVPEIQLHSPGMPKSLHESHQSCQPLENLSRKPEAENFQPHLNLDGDTDDGLQNLMRRKNLSAMVRDDVESLASESDACSINEYVRPKSSKKEKPKNLTDTEKKRKKGRIVPSRYMRPSAKASVSTISDRSTSKKIDKSSASKSLTFSSSTKRSADVTKISSHPERASTPEQPLTQGGKTSTPTMDNSLFPPEIDVDASAIHAETSIVTGHNMNNRPRSAKKTKSCTKSMHAPAPDPFSQSMLSNVSSIHEPSFLAPNKKPAKKAVTQEQLDLIHARNLQFIFLETKARKCIQEQEKQANEQLHALWEDVEKLREKEFCLKQELDTLKHQKLLDKQIHVQSSGLSSVTNTLPQLTCQYKNLAFALDTTRHQIPTSGIYIPDDEDQFNAELEGELEESERLLGEMSIMIREPVPTIESFSNALQTLEKAVDMECHEINRCGELLAATQTLMTRENSLKIGQMQAREDDVDRLGLM